MNEHNSNNGKPPDPVPIKSSHTASNVGTGLAPVLHSPTLPPSSLRQFLDGLCQLGLMLTEQQLDQFILYQQTLLDWNTRINLTTIVDPHEVLIKHFLDSLSLLMAFD